MFQGHYQPNYTSKGDILENRKILQHTNYICHRWNQFCNNTDQYLDYKHSICFHVYHIYIPAQFES